MKNQVVDATCIDRLIHGDEAAFAAVYDCYAQKVYRAALRFLKDTAQSEEVVQEVFIQLWIYRDKLDADRNLWLYIFVITKRLSLNMLRQAHRASNATEKLLLQTEVAVNNTEDFVIQHDIEQFTEKIIEQLPPQQKLIFQLSRVEGLTHKEIADQLHISPNTVKNHMTDALKKLKAQLKYADFGLLVLLFFHK